MDLLRKKDFAEKFGQHQSRISYLLKNKKLKTKILNNVEFIVDNSSNAKVASKKSKV